MKPRESAVIEAAIEWWEDLQPPEYDKQRHIDNPIFGTTTNAESQLATAVAYLVRARGLEEKRR
jgi:hypothetical protein